MVRYVDIIGCSLVMNCLADSIHFKALYAKPLHAKLLIAFNLEMPASP